MEEIWKDIPTYEGYYQVSNLGRIRSIDHYVKCKGNNKRLVKGIIKKPQLNKRGYLITTLTKKGIFHTYTIHQLVAWAFLPNFIKGNELNHINGIKTDNKLDNLELSNSSHNQFHAVRTGLKPKKGKSKYYNVSYAGSKKNIKKRWIGSIRHNGKHAYGFKYFETEEEAAHYVDELLDSVGDTQRLRNFPKS